VSRHNVYRDGHVHVRREMCSTCIFRPGNLMFLPAGRVRRMVDEAKAEGTSIICHQTLEADNAVCRGFFDRHRTVSLGLAVALGKVREVSE
jgi:hypothetical protein